MTTYAPVKELPAVVQRALESAGYHKADIEVRSSETVVLGGMAYGDGYRAFTVLVNLSTNQIHSESGSWGGANAFDRTNAVDNDERIYALPTDGIVIKGQRGGGRPVSATLHIPAAMTSRILPAPGETLTDVERDALAIYVGIRSSYRKEYLRDAHVTETVLAGLVERGLLKRARNGATQITTAGKNAVGSYRVM